MQFRKMIIGVVMGLVLQAHTAQASPPNVYVTETNNGPVSGGTVLNVYGTNLTNVTSVYMGHQPASFTVNADDWMTVVTPVGSAGTVSIVATNADGSSVYGSEALFTYVGGWLAYPVDTLNLQTSPWHATTTPPTASGTTSSIGNYPQEIAITPDGSLAYITNFSLADANQISVVNVATGATTYITDPALASGPYGIAITPDGQTAYVTVYNDLTLVGISLATNTVGSVTNLSANPETIAITPDGTTAYITSSGTSSVEVVALNANPPVSLGLFEIGCCAQSMAIAPNGQTLYVGVSGTPAQFVAIRSAGLASEVVTTLNVGNNTSNSSQWIAITPNGNTAYVCNANDNAVSVVDLTGLVPNVIAAINTIGNQPNGLAITPDGATVYVANGDGSLTYFDVATNGSTQLVNVPATGNASFGAIAITPDQAPYAVFQTGEGTVGSPTYMSALGTLGTPPSVTPTGTIVDYFWDFGDGTTGSGPFVSHVFTTPGEQFVTLTVTNSAGTSTTSSTKFTGKTLSNNGQQYASFPGGFYMVYSPPVVTSICPSFSFTTGGAPVTILGSYFLGATAVNFGSNPAASFTVVDDNTITAIIPAGVAGPASVTVTTAGGTTDGSVTCLYR